MNDKKIEEIAEKLSQKEFIVFAGSGVARAAGIPMWRELIEELLRRKPINHVDIENLGEDEYPDIAQEIYNLFENKDDYYKIIDDILRPTESSYSAPQLEIVKTTNWIVTTNLDKTFESAFSSKFEIKEEQKNTIIYSLPDFEPKNLFSEESIVYLHGRVVVEHIVFKRDDYEKYYPSVSSVTNCSEALEDYLKYIYEKHTIVFIGVSFKDRYMRESLKNIHMKIKKTDDIASGKIGRIPKLDNICHYAFLQKVLPNNNQISKELDKELENIKIQVIRYSEHIDCTKFLEMIRDLKPHKKVSLKR